MNRTPRRIYTDAEYKERKNAKERAKRYAAGGLSQADDAARRRANAAAKPKPIAQQRKDWEMVADGARLWHTGKGTIIIDGDDYERLKGKGWRCTRSGYVQRKTTMAERLAGMGKRSLMHHEVMGRPIPPYVTDHRNGVRSDNRKANLRIATPTQNNQNRQGPPSNSKTGILGVFCPADRRGQYRARIVVNGRKLHLGYFDDLDDAIRARREAERTYFGEFAPVHQAQHV